MSTFRRSPWELALLPVAIFWGYTFVIVKEALERIPPFAYLGIRFLLAALALAAFGGLRGLTGTEMRVGMATGAVLFGGYAFQQVGLQYTSASNAGFITGLAVVLVPIVAGIWFRRMPSVVTVSGVSAAALGLLLLSSPEQIGLNRGEILMLGCASLFALHIVMLGKLAPDLSALRLATVQMGVAGLLGTVSALGLERTSFDASDGFVWLVIALTAFGASAIGFTVQTRAQQVMPPTRTAIILTMEPVAAGVAGFLFAGDTLGLRGWTGGALILAGILWVELRESVTEQV